MKTRCSKQWKRLACAGLLFSPLLILLVGWTILSPLLHWELLLSGSVSGMCALILLLPPPKKESASARPSSVQPSAPTVPAGAKSPKDSASTTSSRASNEHLPYVPRTLRELRQHLTPYEFEIFSAALVIALGEGHRFLNHCGQSGDQGVDTRLLNRFGNVVIVQSKLYAPTNRVGQPQLREFLGCTYHHKAANGYFVTTSTFTRAAQQWIYANNGRIRAIDGQKLEGMLQHKQREIALALRDIKQQVSTSRS